MEALVAEALVAETLVAETPASRVIDLLASDNLTEDQINRDRMNSEELVLKMEVRVNLRFEAGFRRLSLKRAAVSVGTGSASTRSAGTGIDPLDLTIASSFSLFSTKSPQ